MRRCTHKQVYGLLLALSTRIKIREGPNYDGTRLYIRRCRHCKGWFLSNRWRRPKNLR